MAPLAPLAHWAAIFLAVSVHAFVLRPSLIIAALAAALAAALLMIAG